MDVSVAYRNTEIYYALVDFNKMSTYTRAEYT